MAWGIIIIITGISEFYVRKSSHFNYSISLYFSYTAFGSLPRESPIGTSKSFSFQVYPKECTAPIYIGLLITTNHAVQQLEYKEIISVFRYLSLKQTGVSEQLVVAFASFAVGIIDI